MGARINWIWPSLLLAAQLGGQAGTLETVELKPFVGRSTFEKWGVEWLLPRGRQVLDGIPFQISGTIFFYSTNSGQQGFALKTNIEDLAVGGRFDRLHLLAATAYNEEDGVAIARIELNYADGTSAGLDVCYGEQVRDWRGPRHRAEAPLKDPRTRQAWAAQCAAAAKSDSYLRLFHSVLTNPAPDKEVRSLSIRSAKRNAALVSATTRPSTLTTTRPACEAIVMG